MICRQATPSRVEASEGLLVLALGGRKEFLSAITIVFRPSRSTHARWRDGKTKLGPRGHMIKSDSPPEDPVAQVGLASWLP